MPIKPKLLLASLFAFTLQACGDGNIDAANFVVSERARNVATALPCANSNPLKNAYFGDLHVHTALSNDAYSFGVRASPDDAYRFAFAGGEIALPVNKGDRQLTRTVKIDRPLDFMAVTDHAEFLGEQTLCADPASGVADAEFCRAFKEGEGRNPSLLAKIFSPFPSRDNALCGDDGARCAAAAEQPWQQAIDAAEKWNDNSSACERTVFIAFEYSSVRLGSNLHRNVIFKNSVVPKRPISFLDAPREWRLWEILDQQCLSSNSGCDALAIPHNSNISNGRMFAVDYWGADNQAAQVQRARLRMKIEPVVEIMQHKGDSECRTGLSGVLGAEDELCGFEKFENLAFEAVSGSSEPGDCYTGPLADFVPHKGPNCLSRNSYIRNALIEGMKEEQRIGVNPFKVGISAATDTHNATAGAVSERNFAGHLGWGDGTPQRRVAYRSEVPGNASNNPGGLMGVWAEQNTRATLFDSIRKREVFGTSGPRIKPRLFASWDFQASMCDQPDRIQRAYDTGVAMGSDLPPPTAEAPVFLAMASADPGTAAEPATPLQQLQIIKGWYDQDGKHHQRVHVVAGDADKGASVDLASCAQRGSGFQQLCGVWRDPEFAADQRAVYYLRAVENPSCRYSTWQCLQFPESDRPADCSNPKVPKTVQERAWSSPIWYTPE